MDDMNSYGMDSGMAGIGTGMIILYLVLMAFYAFCLWKVFVKAGKPGWAAIIPIYNLIVLLEIVGKPVWWVLLMLIPCVNIVVAVLLYIELAKSFGQGVGFAIGLLLLGFIFLPLLAFGNYEYVGPGGQASSTPTLQ